jgi:hypothetical protein
MKSLDIGAIVPAGDVAKAAGVSRRTVLRGAGRAKAAVELGNTTYVLRRYLRSVVGEDRYTPSVEKLVNPVRGKGTIAPGSVVSKAEAARKLGANACTIFRLIRQFELGTDVYGDTYLDVGAMNELRSLFGRPHPFALDPKLASAAGSLGMKVRWGKKR